MTKCTMIITMMMILLMMIMIKVVTIITRLMKMTLMTMIMIMMMAVYLKTMMIKIMVMTCFLPRPVSHCHPDDREQEVSGICEAKVVWRWLNPQWIPGLSDSSCNPHHSQGGSPEIILPPAVIPLCIRVSHWRCWGTDGWMDGWLMYGCIDDGWMMDEWVDWWKDEWMDG